MGQYALLRRLTESGLETNPHISDRIVRLSVRIAGHIADRLSLAANAAIEIQIRCVCVCVCVCVAGWLAVSTEINRAKQWQRLNPLIPLCYRTTA